MDGLWDRDRLDELFTRLLAADINAAASCDFTSSQNIRVTTCRVALGKITDSETKHHQLEFYVECRLAYRSRDPARVAKQVRRPPE
ncbi:hypothetical protein BZM27_50375 [Paraburkholderia steynii]|uniref:Uncharacterized protein n=1 Tax=Paraburkholderia steynii TaxID=1245441 RepID=A0A4R0XBA5_9BURK|nr:hypothetical protein BZM27_50375 [Paraburkholderia steynii]